MKTIMRITTDPQPKREIKRVSDQIADKLVAESTQIKTEEGVLIQGWFYVPKKVWKEEVRDQTDFESSAYALTTHEGYPK